MIEHGISFNLFIKYIILFIKFSLEKELEEKEVTYVVDEVTKEAIERSSGKKNGKR